MKFKLSWGLGGGFGGSAEQDEVFEFDTEEQAIDYAYAKAVEEYESYEGLHGIRSLDEIKEEDGIEDEDEALCAYNEEMESWLDYSVKEIKE